MEYHRLSEREKAVLRLLARGHDAKSAAQALGLSVHTVNERLRDARRSLGASSSRAAARALAQAEGGQEIRAEKIGVDAPAATAANMGPRDRHGRARRRTVLLLTGVALMLGLAAAFLLHLQPVQPGASAQSAAAPIATARTAAPTYFLSFDIAAVGAPPVRPRLTVRAGEMASLVRSGPGGGDFDISVVANPDPDHADHVMLTIHIVAPGRRQLQAVRTASVGFGEQVQIPVRGDDDGEPVVTLRASVRPVAG